MMRAPDDANLAYANLTPAQILDCIDSAGFVTDGRLLALNSYENRVYQVGIEEADPVVAKFYRPGRWSDAEIREEHGFAAELAAAEIPVVAPLSPDGRSLLDHNGFRFAVYPRRGGRWPELGDPIILTQIGRFVGRVHAVGAASDFEHRPELDVWSFGESSAQTVLEESTLPPELVHPYETLAEDLLDAVGLAFEQTEPFARLRLHGDLHPGNLLARDDDIHIVDLDDARSGPAVQDLWMLLSGSRGERESQLAAVLDGYTEFHDFNARELRLIEALRALRMMHYAAWLTRRFEDPAFQQAFPWFAEPRYWEGHVLSLREQLAELNEAPLQWHR